MSAAIREIRRIYPAAHITLVVEKNAGNLAEFCPHIDELHIESFRINDRLLMGLPVHEHLMEMYSMHLKIAQNLLTRRYDLAFAANYGVNSTMPLLSYMSGARERISHLVGSKVFIDLLTEIVSQEDYGTHAADKTLSYIEHLLRLPIANRELEAWVDETDLEFAQSILPGDKKIYAIGLGGHRPRKHYPPKFYAEFMNILMKRDDALKFVILGGSTEKASAALLMEDVDGSRVVDLTGKTTFRQTTAMLDRCLIYIGNDTGTMHLAAATGTPVLNPNCFSLDLDKPYNVLKRWYPYEVPSVIICPSHALPECRPNPSFFGCCAEEPHCIKQITPKNLFDAFKLLQRQIRDGARQPLIVGSK